MKTRPDWSAYLSSRLTCRTRSGAFMSACILPGREPAPQRFAHLRGPLKRREMASVLEHVQDCAGDRSSHFLVPFDGCEGVLPAAQHECRAGDVRQERQTVDAAHDRPFLPDE